jgi:hypothetical protein
MAAVNTGYTSISASIQDSKEIPTAICMFLESGNSIKPSERLHIETGTTCISASIQDSKESPEANPVFSGSGNSMALVMLNLETGSQICKMAAAKPEVPVFQLLYKIGKTYQQLSACFRCRETQ